jgi:hypothetical protein
LEAVVPDYDKASAKYLRRWKSNPKNLALLAKALQASIAEETSKKKKSRRGLGDSGSSSSSSDDSDSDSSVVHKKRKANKKATKAPWNERSCMSMARLQSDASTSNPMTMT